MGLLPIEQALAKAKGELKASFSYAIFTVPISLLDSNGLLDEVYSEVFQLVKKMRVKENGKRKEEIHVSVSHANCGILMKNFLNKVESRLHYMKR